MITTLILAGILIFMVINFAAIHTWIERKQSAVMQDRIGANRAWIVLPWKWATPINWLLAPVNKLGLLHPLADAIKMFTKEDYIPPFGDKFLHTLSPFLALAFSLVGFAAIPFGDIIVIHGREIILQVAPVNVALLYLFAMMSMGVYGVILAGFSSNNNYAFLGGMRAAAQMLAYEITLGATILGIVMIFGTIDLQEIVRAQGKVWGVFLQPVGFLLFLAAGLAETKRTPYDMPEAESEIVGYFTEYSGMKFGMFYFADFVETIMISALATTLFLGGWQVPFLMRDGFHFFGHFIAVAQPIVATLQISSFAFKVLAFAWFFMTIRWTLPRFRYDQLMELGWKRIFPISLANLFITALVLLIWDKIF